MYSYSVEKVLFLVIQIIISNSRNRPLDEFVKLTRETAGLLWCKWSTIHLYVQQQREIPWHFNKQCLSTFKPTTSSPYQVIVEDLRFQSSAIFVDSKAHPAIWRQSTRTSNALRKAGWSRLQKFCGLGASGFPGVTLVLQPTNLHHLRYGKHFRCHIECFRMLFEKANRSGSFLCNCVLLTSSSVIWRTLTWFVSMQ